jgi:DNA-binding MarR family transcriptional regulator
VVRYGYEVIGEREVGTYGLRASIKRVKGRFLKGPILFREIDKAGQLSGGALWLYLIIRHRLDISKKLETTIPSEAIASHGMDRWVKDRAIRALEDAGLIQVKRHSGRSTIVSLCRSEQAAHQ